MAIGQDGKRRYDKGKDAWIQNIQSWGRIALNYWEVEIIMEESTKRNGKIPRSCTSAKIGTITTGIQKNNWWNIKETNNWNEPIGQQQANNA